MDLSAWRQRVYASNVANAATPGYRRQEVRFADELRRAEGRSLALKVTQPGHLGHPRAQTPAVEIYEDTSADGSSGVDVEREMVSVAENQLRFSLAARLASLRIQALRSSVRK